MPTARKFLVPALAALAALVAFGLPAQAERPAGETTAAAEKAAKPAKRKKRSCAFRRSINGFTVIDEKHLILQSGARNYFLLTLSPGCHHLDFEMAIAIKSTPAAGICVERGDRVILDDHFTCWIRDIEPVESKEEARKLVAERTKPKDADGESGDAADEEKEDKTDVEAPN